MSRIAKWVTRSSRVGGRKSNKATSTLSVIIRWENELWDWWYRSPLILLQCTDRTTAAEQTIFLLCSLSRPTSSSTTGDGKYQNLREQMCLTAGADVSRGGTVSAALCSHYRASPEMHIQVSSLWFANKVVTMVTGLRPPVAIPSRWRRRLI